MVGNSLRIGIVAPPWFEIPPRGYGGIESVTAVLVDALVDRGHDVTVIGAGRNGTRGRFIRTYDTPPSHRLGDPLPDLVHAAATANILDQLDLDIIHDRSVAGPLLARGRHTPTVVTTHNPVTADRGAYYTHLDEVVHLVALSEAQRTTNPELNWCATVANAINTDNWPFADAKQDWVLFLGRANPDKGMHVAIDAARAAGYPITLAAKCIEPVEHAYFDTEIRPRLGPDTLWLGEAATTVKRRLLAHARCLLFPIQWDEPFGNVLLEALACGTPVVALNRGPVPEIITHNVTGYICDTPADIPDAIRTTNHIDPHQCRKDVTTRFSPNTMATRLEAIYHHAIAQAEADGTARVNDHRGSTTEERFSLNRRD